MEDKEEEETSTSSSAQIGEANVERSSGGGRGNVSTGKEFD